MCSPGALGYVPRLATSRSPPPVFGFVLLENLRVLSQHLEIRRDPHYR